MRPSLPRFTALATIVFAAALAFGATSSPGAIRVGNGTYLHDAQLNQPTTLAPVHGAVLQYPTNPIKFTWRPVPGASRYDVQIAAQPSSDVDCSGTVAWQPDNILLTHSTTELGWVPELTDQAHGSDIWTGTYCWRVRAAGSIRPGSWSSGSRFTLTWSAQAQNLRFYSDESGDIPRATGTAGESQGFDTGYLEWDPVAGATQYEVQISNATTFGAASLFSTKIYPATRLLLPQMPDNLYTWRVRPITSTGIKGSWSSTATFRIFHDDRYWGGSSNSTSNTLFPANGATVDDLRIGWEPVPGAAYYRYMALDDHDLFTELENLVPYGTPRSGTNCSFMGGRLSAKTEADASTINNWVTAGALLGDDVMLNLTVPCTYTTPGPDGEEGTDDDVEVKRLPDLPDVLYWRVYPVWHIDNETEQSWDVKETVIYGKPVQRGFQPVPYGAAEIAGADGPVAGNRCRRDDGGGSSTSVNCLRLQGGGLSPLNSSMNSSTMQVPVFKWGTYEGRYAAGEGPGSFRVHVAQDRNFVFKLRPAGQPLERGWIANRGPLKRDAWASTSNGLTRFGGFTRSFAFTTGLPDEGDTDGDGYFWRSIPCQSGHPLSVNAAGSVCGDQYSDDPTASWSPGIATGVAGSGALEFRKRVEVDTAVVAGFTPTTPLLRVGPEGASGYSDWQRGIQGADHYEFEVARNLAFDVDAKTYKTSVPRLVPWGDTPADVIRPGTWFWRVRAVDRDGLAGSWSAASSFTATAPAPAISADSTTMGVGGTVEWSPVSGANGYEVEWSTDSGFSTGVTKQETRQTAYYIPATAAGQLYWRVRAKVGATSFGQWSAPRAITVLSPSRIPFGVSRYVVNVRQLAIVQAQLIIAGTERNGQRVLLQRKSSSCEGTGSYRTIGTGVSGRNLDDGFVRFRMRISASYCYRFAWNYATGTLYSAAFEIGARPVISFAPMQRRVKRGRPFCSRIVANAPLNGRLGIQYRVGRVWVNARTVTVRNTRRRTQCAAINRGGAFPVRLVYTPFAVGTRGIPHELTIRGGGIVRTNDAFVIIRHGRR